MTVKNDYKKNSLNQNFVSKESQIGFKCAQCGACCRNIAPQDKIILSAVDLYRAAKALDMEVSEILAQYCDMIPGKESMLPLVVLKERLDGSCIFLKKGKCIVHESKPVACALNPLGRIMFLNDETGDHEFHYFLKEFDCAASRTEKVTVQQWLDEHHIEEYDECTKLYKRLGSICSKLMHQAKTDKDRQEMFSTAFYLMYAKYTKDEDLYGQLGQNLAFIQSINPEIAFDPSKLN